MTAQAIERLALYFAGVRTRQGVLARAALQRADPADAALRERLRSDLAGAIRADGSVGSGAVPTIWRVHELLDLGEPPDAPAVARALGWLVDLQDRPGAFQEGCDRARHARQICSHFLSGFFAPAPPAQRLAPVTLPTGKVFRVEAAARFAISCLALRAALRAGYGRREAVRRHVDSLARMSLQFTEWNGYFSPDTIVAGLHALAVAGPQHRRAIDRLVDLITMHQGIEGEWAQADLFQVLDALMAAGTLEAQVAVRRAATSLAAKQRADGTFGTSAQQERALIGLRAFLWASRSPV
jgi:hypothetical protein